MYSIPSRAIGLRMHLIIALRYYVGNINAAGEPTLKGKSDELKINANSNANCQFFPYTPPMY